MLGRRTVGGDRSVAEEIAEAVRVTQVAAPDCTERISRQLLFVRIAENLRERGRARLLRERGKARRHRGHGRGGKQQRGKNKAHLRLSLKSVVAVLST
jgi:hypothetical protein